MMQNLIMLLSFVVLSIFSWIPTQDIKVNMDAPAEVRAGEEFIVTLQIYKGDLESFSRYTQSLPYGLTAERLNTANADFSFDEQRVRIIWLKLPPEDSITVSYKVKIDPRLTGSFELSGDFAFVNENERNLLSARPGHMINIIPNPSIAENERINIEDFQNLAQSGTDSYKIMQVERSEPEKTSAFEYTVELHVRKGDLSKFAKIEEYIPQGFRVIEGESRNGIFSFNQGVVKILWMNLPEEREFTVSYKIVPDPGVNIEDFDANGNFSYITGNETKSVDIIDEGASPAEFAEQAGDLEEEDLEKIEEPEVTETVEDKVIEEPEKATEVAETEDFEEPAETFEEEVSEKSPVMESQPVEEEAIEPEISTRDTDPSYMLDPETGVYYRVQLAAGHREINIEKYFKRLNVQDEVKMEFHEGWRKYTTGSFDIYKNARDYRNKIWETTPINGAFVSAYNDGSRITVQEALMITDQKWFR
ncbi:MAG: hypothetical protein ACOCWA_06025 [Bacteroidota bacterium]